jgi:hypothetical protein
VFVFVGDKLIVLEIEQLLLNDAVSVTDGVVERDSVKDVELVRLIEGDTDDDPVPVREQENDEVLLLEGEHVGEEEDVEDREPDTEFVNEKLWEGLVVPERVADMEGDKESVEVHVLEKEWDGDIVGELDNVGDIEGLGVLL